MFPGVEKYFLKFYRKKERNKFYVFSLLSEKERNGTWPFNISPFRSAPYQNHCYVHSSNGAERNAFDSDGNIAISLAIQYFPFPLRSAPLRTRIIATFTVPTERSGALLTVMGTLQFLEPFNISLLRSAPLFGTKDRGRHLCWSLSLIYS